MEKHKHLTLALSAIVCGMLAAGASDASAKSAALYTETPELKPSVIPAGTVLSTLSSESSVTLKNGTPLPDMLRIPFREAAGNTPIVDQPKGECEDYVRETYSYWSIFGSVFNLIDRGSIAKIVKGEDDTVYYYSPFGMQAVGSWLKGTIDESGIMTFPLPQPVMTLAGTEYFASAMEFVDGSFIFSEVQEYQFQYDGDNVVATDTELVLALTTWANADKTSLGWTGYGDKEPLCVPLTEKALVPPATLEAEEWGMIAGSNISNVNVGIENGNVWIQGFSNEIPEAWTLGTISGDKVTISSKQFMGPNYNTGHYEYLQACSIDSVLNPQFEIWDEKINVNEKVEMNYDSELQMMCALSNNNILFATTADPGPDGEYSYATIIREPILKKQDRKITTPPMAPLIVEYSPYIDEFSYGYVKFMFPPYDENYNIINTADLYYELWVNGKPFVFYPDEYNTIEDEMELVPYSFTDYYWFETKGLNRTVYFFFDGASSMGVKTVYKTDEITVYSDYTAIIGDPAVSVDGIENEAAVKAEEYFDLQGRRISGDAEGIRIVKKTMSDGSVSTFKTVKH